MAPLFLASAFLRMRQPLLLACVPHILTTGNSALLAPILLPPGFRLGSVLGCGGAGGAAEAGGRDVVGSGGAGEGLPFPRADAHRRTRPVSGRPVGDLVLLVCPFQGQKKRNDRPLLVLLLLPLRWQIHGSYLMALSLLLVVLRWQIHGSYAAARGTALVCGGGRGGEGPPQGHRGALGEQAHRREY